MADDMDAASQETRLDRLERKLDDLLAVRHVTAEHDEATRLGRPTTVEEQVRAELQRADDERKAQAAADADAADRQSVKEELAAVKAKLAEAPPSEPVARRTRAMWGKP
jgi:hypothetical protein